MSEEIRHELRQIARRLRAEVAREQRLGRHHTSDPAVVEWMAAPAAPRYSIQPPTPAPAPKAALSAPAAPRYSIQPPAPARAPKAALSAPANRALPALGLPADDTRDLAAMDAGLSALREAALVCRKCGLCETRTQVVYGVGTARQPLMFVGEAPGYHEDQQGVPFVGQAGRLLTDIITAMGFDRKDVYIANVLKCRPPENRDPLPREMESCQPWLERQIELIRPRVICTVGKYSAQLLTGKGPKATIGNLRGKIFHYRGIPVVPTYHPAFLLRSPSYKRATWEDVQLVRELYLSNGSTAEPEGFTT